ncbi:hypothetical protein D3C85_1823770 [compost metagenome]
MQQAGDQFRHQLGTPAHITDQQIKFIIPEFDFPGIFAQDLQPRQITERLMHQCRINRSYLETAFQQK